MSVTCNAIAAVLSDHTDAQVRVRAWVGILVELSNSIDGLFLREWSFISDAHAKAGKKLCPALAAQQ